MADLRVMVERPVAAPPEVVYRCMADFRRHHHRFLPPQFVDYKVEEGGIGAGTVLSFKVRAGGPARAYRTRVEEPQPGKVLVERDTLSPLVTTTTVTPDGTGSRVRLETVWPPSDGIAGLVERLFAPVVMRRIYLEEIARLERYASGLAAGA